MRQSSEEVDVADIEEKSIPNKKNEDYTKHLSIGNNKCEKCREMAEPSCSKIALESAVSPYY